MTPRVAALVEDAAFRAKLAVSNSVEQSPHSYDDDGQSQSVPDQSPRDADGEIVDLDPASFAVPGVHRKSKPVRFFNFCTGNLNDLTACFVQLSQVATAGDALLSWILSECEVRARENDETNASVELMERDVVSLLARVDALCDAVPSRRLAKALRDTHRARLRLVDARAKARALDATRDYLRGIVLDARDIGEEASARAGGGGGGGRRDGPPAPETMASEFFYCLELGGMLR